MGLHRLAKAGALAAAIVFGVGTVAAVISASEVHAADKKVYTLKLSHFVPPQHAFHKWVVKWTEKIDEGIGRAAQVPDLSERPAGRAAEPAVRRRA